MKRNVAAVLALITSTLVLPSLAWGATRNVNNAAGCSDTSGSPYCTINAAILAAAPGDTIQIAAGTYAGTIASFSKPLTFVGAGSTTSGTVITKSVTYAGTGPLSVSNLRVSGGGTNFKVGGTGNFSGLTISGASFVGNGGGAHGLFIKQNGTVSNVTVTNSTFTNHGQSGMLIQLGTGSTTDVDHVTVTGSTFDSNGEYGLRIDPRVTSLQVSSSNITNNAIDGLLLLNANGATLQNLTITGNRNGILLIPLTSSQSISNLTLTNVNASNNTKFISGHYGSGITFTGDTGSISQITITGSTFSGNGIHGVDATGAVSQVSIDCSVIAGNVQQGIHEASSPSAQLTAKHIYWGCATGPNTAGCSTVSGNVAFLPFRTSATATCAPAVDLGVTMTAIPNPVATGGSLTYTVTAMNNGPDPATGVVLTDTLPATVTFVSASSGCTLSGATVTCSIGNLASGGQAVGTITVTAPASAGSVTNSVTIAGNETPDPNTANNTASVTTTVQSAVTLTSITVTPSSASLISGQTVQLTATAIYSDNSTQDVTAQAVWTTSASAVATVSTAGLVTASSPGSATITASFNAQSATAAIAVFPSEPLPPDPSTVASAIDPTVVTTVFESTKFLYSGANPIQTGVAAGTIVKQRACVLRGTVRERSGTALPGVAITILGHPELGSTKSRLDGMFDLAVNGGGPLTVVYRKSGYIEGQRQVATGWNDFRLVPDIALIPYDGASTTIASGNAQYQVARGSSVSDDRGTRRATILLPPNTTATMLLPDGSTSSLPSMTVRASEYSVGPNGPTAMPAQLPPQTSYTYCVELSADEAVAAGAQSISFSNPVAFYLENFLSLPVGSNVPVGFYDRIRGVWVDQENGLVVQIVAITGGRAYLDVDGDGLADDSDSLIGTTPAERDLLATLYGAGQKLWRASLTHFTPYDLNLLAYMNSGVGATEPEIDPPDSATPAENCSTGCGSIIDIEDQVLREPIPLQGTPFSLMYSTRTAPGFTPGQDVTINASKDTVPATLTGISVEVSVAGQVARYDLPPLPNQSAKFHWDGRDTYGRPVQGPAQASIFVGYRYPTFYWTTPSLRAIFADWFGSSPLAQGLIAQDRVIANTKTLALGHLDSRASDVAGWNLDIHHVYDPVSSMLYEGNGTVRAAKILGPVVQSVTGTGTGSDNLAINLQLKHPLALAAAPDGSTYVSDQQFGNPPASPIYRIKQDGTYEFVANGCCDTADGPIANTRFRPVSMSVASDGTLYMLDDSPNGPLVRAVSGGQVTTIAGGGQTAVSDDAIPGLTAQLRGDKLTVAADGAIYVTGSSTVTRVSTSGLVRHLAGDPSGSGSTGDGGSSRSASFDRASGAAIGPSGSLYVADSASIRRIAPNGIIETLAPADNANDSGFNSSSIVVDANENLYVNTGRTIVTYDVQGNARTFAGGGTIDAENVPATAVALGPVGDLTASPDGSIYFLDFNRVKRVTAPLPGLSSTEFLIASQDGSQAYVFDENGRHLRTVDAETGVIVYRFGYDTNGRLTTVTDADGNVTSIQRDAGGTPVALVAPGGQITTLTLGSDGYLARAANAAGEAMALTYDSGGLLKTLTDARGGLHQFSYSADGRLIKDQDPGGGFTSLTRSGTERSFGIAQTTAEGRTGSYVYSTAVDGAVSRSATDSAGLTTISNRTAARTSSGHGPDGSSFTGAETPDPRFGLQAPITNSTMRTPGFLTLSQSSDRAVTLTTPGDPLSVGSLTEHLRINGRTYTRTYSAVNRSSTLSTPAGRTMSLVIDNKNHVSSVSPAGLTATGFTYTSSGQLSTLQTGSRQTQFLYDGQRRLHSVTDALQRTVTFDYDNADRVTTQTLPDGRQIAFTYDHNGNLTAVTPPTRPQHLFTYTSTDLQSAYTPPTVPNGGATQYAYNRDKQLTLVTRPDSSTVALSYDGAGRVATLAIARGTYQYAHDAASGNLTSITAPDGGLMTFAYDGSLLKDASWTGGVVGSIHWDYDNDFAVSAETVNCPTAVTLACSAIAFSYDQDRLLVGAGDLALSRDPQNGLLTGTSIGSLNDTWTYNSFAEPLNYVAAYGGAEVFNQQYTRDDVGRIAQKSETIAGVTSQFSYGYDAAGRLTDVTKDGVNISHYTYDGNGNRLSRTTPVGSEAGSYDAQDRLLTYNATSYAYTAAGELSTRTDSNGTTSFTYDELGNLNHVTLANGPAIDYLIDGQNKRVGEKINGTFAQRFIYTGRVSPAAELDANGDVVTRFVYATHPNTPDLIIKGDITYRVIADHRGSPRLIIRVDDGSVAQRMDFDEFGNVLSDTNPGFQPFGFAGGLYDAGTKLVRFGARDYDPQTGRWTAKDPVSFLGRGANLYGYVFADPVNLVDATGLTATCTYHQETGQLTCVDNGTKKGIVDEAGYSGKGAKKNSPSNQCDIDEGPIPRGTYSIGTAYDTTTHGPKVLPLTPDSGNNMCSPERSGFLIHGDSASHPGEASEGCIIMSRSTRDAIDDAGGGTLTVVEK